jgi:putative chitinase
MTPLITADHLAAIAGRRTSLMSDLAHWIAQICPRYEIDARHEYCHFLAQACHETDRFKTLREYASGAAYEGRTDLGNTQPGDGVKFKGRGIFQTTGRANYLQLGIRRGQRDLFIRQPELLEQPEYAVWSACEFWQLRRLNDIANHADTDVLKKKYRGKILEVSPVEYISITINGGYNGVSERKRYYAAAQEVLPLDIAGVTVAATAARITTAVVRVPRRSKRKKVAKRRTRHKAHKVRR